MRTPNKNNSRKKQISQEIIAQIKNALTVILGNAELLLRQEEGLSEEGKERGEKIKKQVWRIDGELAKGDFSPLGQKKRRSQRVKLGTS